MKEPASPQVKYRKDYKPSDFLISHTQLDIAIYSGKTQVTATLTCTRAPDAAADAALRLDGEDLTLLQVKLDGALLAESAYQQDAEGLTVLQVPDNFTLETLVEIQPENNTSLEGLYRSSSMYCTQCEAHGFRKITYYLDRPDVLSEFTTRLSADKAECPVLLSNGNCVEQGELPDGRHWAQWHDPHPKPCYLFALVAGQLSCIEDHYVTSEGRKVLLQIFVEPVNIDKCAHAMRSLIESMQWDEQRFGLAYDLDRYMIVAVGDFNMGAMENKGLNIFNTKYVLANPKTATDTDFLGIQSVIGHEYFHNWTGNRVTCRDWFQLSLKEGLTVFRDQEFSSDLNSRAVQRIDDVNVLRSHQFAEDSGPMAHPIRPDAYIEMNNFYTVTVYNKGAEVIRMQHTLLGEAGFRAGMDLYFQRHDGQAVTCDDFVQAMADASGRDLTQFKHWYSQAGTPELTFSGHYEASRAEYQLTVQQQCPATPQQATKQPFHLPIRMALLSATGEPLDSQYQQALQHEHVLELTQAEQTFTFTQVSTAPIPSLLRQFSAPVKWQYPYALGELATLVIHDTDEFARWEAAQMLWLQTITQLVADYQAQRPLQVAVEVVQVFERLLAEPQGDAALLARILTLPNLQYLSELLQPIDVDALFAAREALLTQVATQLYPQWKETYTALNPSGEYSLSAEAIACRSLKNGCLMYLAYSGQDDVAEILTQQYATATNMTDRLAALSAQIRYDWSLAQADLADFYQQFADEPLVVDKWLSLQAMADHPQALQQVQALLDHPAFSLNNPNKVRALLGCFAQGYVRAFHTLDGSGYQFVAQQIAALDQLNPQVAARLARAFMRWRKYTEPRRQLQRQALETLSQAKLSKDVYEIVSKSLAETD